MKLVKNDIVNMDWDADGFIETKKAGFISAVHNYGGVAVAFKDGKAYAMCDMEGNVMNFSELVKIIKSSHRKKDSKFPYYYDDCVEIYDGSSLLEDNLKFLGIEEHSDDIIARCKDINAYNCEYVVE